MAECAERAERLFARVVFATFPMLPEKPTPAPMPASYLVRTADPVLEMRAAQGAASIGALIPKSNPESNPESKSRAPRQTRLQVIKVGGSLYGAPALKGVLHALSCEARAACVVVVPGGGRFADAVRVAQTREGFSDAEAHLKALQAMDAAGVWLGRCLEARGSSPTVLDVDALETLSRTAAGPGLPTGLWLVSGFPTLMWEPALPVGWQTTSDTVALWCAQKLLAEELCLYKSAGPGTRSLEELAQAEYLDRQFPLTFAAQPLPCSVVWPGEPEPVWLWPNSTDRTQEESDRTAKTL